MIDDRIQFLEISTNDDSTLPRISNFIKIDSNMGVFSNVWAIADTDSCGDPDCGCDND